VHVAKPIPTCELFHVLFFMMKLEGNVQVCKRKYIYMCEEIGAWKNKNKNVMSK
jgi:hypothetical protein